MVDVGSCRCSSVEKLINSTLYRYPDIAGNIFGLIIDFTVQTQYIQRGDDD